MSASNTLEESIGNHLLRTGSWTKPTAIYVALFTTLPIDDGTGGVEVSGGSYARVLHGPSDATWDAPTDGSGSFRNATAVQFAAPTGDWGLIVGFGLFYASTGGTMCTCGSLTAPYLVNNGDAAPAFAAGTLSVTIG